MVSTSPKRQYHGRTTQVANDLTRKGDATFNSDTKRHSDGKTLTNENVNFTLITLRRQQHHTILLY